MPSHMSSSRHTELARDQVEESSTALESLLIVSMQFLRLTAICFGLERLFARRSDRVVGLRARGSHSGRGLSHDGGSLDTGRRVGVRSRSSPRSPGAPSGAPTRCLRSPCSHGHEDEGSEPAVHVDLPSRLGGMKLSVVSDEQASRPPATRTVPSSRSL